MREIRFNPEAREKMLVGFNRAADVIGGTLGPKGGNVAVWNDMTPMVMNDGATIAKEGLVCEDPVENFGMHFIRNTSSQSADDAGDGTTTTAVLLQAIVREALKRPEAPVEVGRSIQEAAKKLVKELKKKSHKLKDEQIEQVARVSAEDERLAKVIARIVKERGKDLLFLVEDNRDGEDIVVENIQGYEAYVGWAVPMFITDKARARAVHEDMPVLVCDKKIENHAQIKKIFDDLATNGINRICIVAYDLDDAIMGSFVATHMRRLMSILVIKATGPLLEDIAGCVGATRISDQEGVTFAKFDITKHLGVASKIVCDENKTLFVPKITTRAASYSNILESRALNEANHFRRDKLLERVAKIRSGVALIKVGAPTDTEREYLKLKADDAAKAVKCAIEEGIVEGGGIALWRIAQALTPRTIGEEILRVALTSPFKKICENAGVDYAEVVSNMPEGWGYDARTGQYVKMIEEGIIDPTKVERVALINAASTAAKFITTFAVITSVPPKKE